MHSISLHAFRRSTRGASMVEYIAIAGLVALLALVGFQKFGTSLYSQSRTYGDHVQSLTPLTGKSSYCFVAGTLVLTPTGLVPIETVRSGDAIVSAGEDGGALVVARASDLSVTPNAPLVAVHFRESDEPIVATPGHPFHSPTRGWVQAAHLFPDEEVDDAAHAPLHVARVEALARRATVYNFEVAGTHTYFVGAAGAWVHNPTDCNGDPIMPGSYPADPAPGTNDGSNNGAGDGTADNSGGGNNGSWLLNAFGAGDLADMRASYVGEVEGIGPQAAQMLADGKSEEDVAKWAHEERRRIGLKYKYQTPLIPRTAIYIRNYNKYGDTLGPSIDYLHDKKGKSWADIIASSSTAGGQDLGLQSSAPP